MHLHDASPVHPPHSDLHCDSELYSTSSVITAVPPCFKSLAFVQFYCLYYKYFNANGQQKPTLDLFFQFFQQLLHGLVQDGMSVIWRYLHHRFQNKIPVLHINMRHMQILCINNFNCHKTKISRSRVRGPQCMIRFLSAAFSKS